MIEYPYMLYKHPGPHEIHGSSFDTLIVCGDEGMKMALDGGWQTSTYAALKVVNAPIPKTICDPDGATEAVEMPGAAPPVSVGKPVRWKK